MELRIGITSKIMALRGTEYIINTLILCDFLALPSGNRFYFFAEKCDFYFGFWFTMNVAPLLGYRILVYKVVYKVVYALSHGFKGVRRNRKIAGV